MLCALPAFADGPGVTNIVNGGTNSVLHSATNTLTAFATSEFDNVGLQFNLKANAAGTSTVRVEGYRSLNNPAYEDTPQFTFLMTLNGTALVTVVTNVYSPSTGYLKLKIGNTNAALDLTNLTVTARFNSPRRR